MLGKTQNQALQQVEQAVQAKVPPAVMPQFQRIVTAGLKVMYSDQSHHLMAQELAKPGDPTEIVGEGIAKLMAILFRESKGTLQMNAMMPAATVLCCEALDFAEQSGKLTADNDTISKTVKEMMSSVLQVLGISPQKLQQVMQGQQQPGAAPPPPAMPPAPQPAAAPQGIIGAAQGA